MKFPLKQKVVQRKPFVMARPWPSQEMQVRNRYDRKLMVIIAAKRHK